MSSASLVISIVAITISLIALWKTHFAPFSAIAVAGRLKVRIYPIKSGSERWFIGSLDVPISVTNPGAQPGIVNGLRVRLHFPKIPIPANYELIRPTFEIEPKDAKMITKNRFHWTDEIVVGGWMPFTVLPKTTVTKHFVFETRWEYPVVQDAVDCTLQIRTDKSDWNTFAKWTFSLSARIWSEHVNVGTAISYDPDKAKDSEVSCMPSDLHKYTGTKEEIPKGGFLAGDSYLDYPPDDTAPGHNS